MENTTIGILLLAGAVAWTTTALVSKSGPFNILLKFRHFIGRFTQGNSPLECFHCTSFWVGLVLLSVYVSGDPYSRALIEFLGVLGVAQALRGMSGEWK